MPQLQPPKPNVPQRFSLLGIIRGLMVADNMGDVHDEINHLCDLAGVERPEGNFLLGWEPVSWENVGGRPDQLGEHA